MRNFKKILLSILVLIFISLAQGSFGQIPVTFNTGFTSSKFETSDDAFNDRISRKRGFVFGIGAEVPITGPLSLVNEIYFISKGAKVDDRNVRHYFIQHNWIFRYSFPVNEDFNVYFNAGPAFGYLSGGKNRRLIPESMVQDTSLPALENASEFEGLDLGIEFGFGANYTYGPGKIVVDIRFNNSLLNYARDIPNQDSFFSRNWFLAVGYSMNFSDIRNLIKRERPEE